MNFFLRFTLETLEELGSELAGYTFKNHVILGSYLSFNSGFLASLAQKPLGCALVLCYIDCSGGLGRRKKVSSVI